MVRRVISVEASSPGHSASSVITRDGPGPDPARGFGCELENQKWREVRLGGFFSHPKMRGEGSRACRRGFVAYVGDDIRDRLQS
jgi:hypothetical protein